MANTLLGSAVFSSFSGSPKEEVLDGTHLILGRNEEKPHLFYGTKPKRHYLGVAPTRSGKGVSLILPNLLIYKGSAIVIDPKGENAWITAQRRRDMGQAVHILDPWGEVNRRYGDLCGKSEEIATFSPLSILDPASEHFADDVAYLADSLIINQGKDPHWDNSARELVAGLIAFAAETKGEAASLPLVRIMLCKPAAEIAGIATEAAALGPKSLAAKKLARFKFESKEMAGIVSTAQTQTAFLDSEKLSENMLESSFAFSDLVKKEGATIYLVLPVDKLQTYGRWLRLLVSIGIRTMARNTAPIELPVLFMLDEFGTIGKLSAVSQAVGLMAGLQMCVWAFVQDLLQLKRDYPDEWETFIANAGAIICFGAMDQTTTEYISKMLGQSTVERISIKSEEQRAAGGPEMMTDQAFARPLRTPDEVRRMSTEKGYIIYRGSPIVFEKIPYYESEPFAALARINPLFPVKEKKPENEKAAVEKVGPTKKISRSRHFLSVAGGLFLCLVFGALSTAALIFSNEGLTHEYLMFLNRFKNNNVGLLISIAPLTALALVFYINMKKPFRRFKSDKG